MHVWRAEGAQAETRDAMWGDKGGGANKSDVSFLVPYLLLQVKVNNS